MRIDRINRMRRFFQGTALVALLAVSGFFGAYREEVRTVSVPVTTAGYEQDNSTGAQENDWEREIALLDQVIADAPGEIADAAQEKKLGLLERMEREKLAQTALEQMGHGEARAVCGQEALLVFAPHASLDEEDRRLQLIDGVCMATGVSAAQVKIILTKK